MWWTEISKDLQINFNVCNIIQFTKCSTNKHQFITHTHMHAVMHDSMRERERERWKRVRERVTESKRNAMKESHPESARYTVKGPGYSREGGREHMHTDGSDWQEVRKMKTKQTRRRVDIARNYHTLRWMLKGRRIFSQTSQKISMLNSMLNIC